MQKLRGTEGVHFYKSDSVVCEPMDDKPVYAQIDGEPLARLPIEFKIVPRALKLLVPRVAPARPLEHAAKTAKIA
jgi:diacylglycerol kinase family enzyme